MAEATCPRCGKFANKSSKYCDFCGADVAQCWAKAPPPWFTSLETIPLKKLVGAKRAPARKPVEARENLVAPQAISGGGGFAGGALGQGDEAADISVTGMGESLAAGGGLGLEAPDGGGLGDLASLGGGLDLGGGLGDGLDLGGGGLDLGPAPGAEPAPAPDGTFDLGVAAADAEDLEALAGLQKRPGKAPAKAPAKRAAPPPPAPPADEGVFDLGAGDLGGGGLDLGSLGGLDLGGASMPGLDLGAQSSIGLDLGGASMPGLDLGAASLPGLDLGTGSMPGLDLGGAADSGDGLSLESGPSTQAQPAAAPRGKTAPPAAKPAKGEFATLAFDPSASRGELPVQAPPPGKKGAGPGAPAKAAGPGVKGPPEPPTLGAGAGRSGGAGAMVSSPDVDFSALAGGGMEGFGAGSAEVDFSSLSSLSDRAPGDNPFGSLSMGDMSAPDLGGATGEVDFSAIADGGSLEGLENSMDFSGLSSLEFVPPPAGAGAAQDGFSMDAGATDVYDLDDNALNSGEDELLKASLLNYKPPKR